jgi:single-stranded-DNA-specific exonuclease
MPKIKNLQKVANRIKKAVKNKEKFIIYGDADLDGVASVIILKESIKNLGGEISAIYFPDRENEGYGITEKGLEYLKNFSPAVFITLDLGIGNFEEVKVAKKLGFEVIIIDHHQVLGKIPQASIVVDPKQKGEKYPFKNLATAGIVFKLSEVLLKERLTQKLKENFLELVALATIADLMPRVEENTLLIEEGLDSLKNTWRPGLKVFSFIESVRNYRNFQEFTQKIISSLNAAEKKDHLNEAYFLLTEQNEKKAKILAKELLEKSQQKHLRIKEIVGEIEERIFKKPKEEIIFEGENDWPLALLGPVASRICQKYQKPTFLFRLDKEKSQGAVRVPLRFDSVKLMSRCSKLLETYGGHAQASGFRVKNENLEKFKNCLIKQVR